MLKRVGHESRLRPGFRKLSIIVTLFAALGVIALWAQKPAPPPSRVEDVRETIQGVEVVDPYRWLEDQQSPETRAWIEAQNKYTRSFLDSWPGRAALRQRLTELMRIDTVSIPTQKNGRYFFKKRLATQDQGVLYVRKGLAGNDEVLVDPNPMSADKNISASIEEVSQDGRVLCFALRQGGEDEVTIRFLDVDSHGELPDRLPRGNYFGLSLKPDRSGCYYARQEKDGPRVYYHVMGSDPAKDLEIFGKGYGPDKIIVAGLSEDGRYLIFHVLYGSVGEKTEVYFQDLAGKAGILPIVNDLPARFFGDVGGDRLFLWTNWKAPKGRILAVDLRNPARDKWRELVPESEAVIEMMGAVGRELVVQYVQSAASRLKIFAADGHRPRKVELGAIGSVSGISGRWTSKEVFYGFTSFHMPPTIYRFEVDSGRQEVWARQQVPIPSERFQVQQVWYESKDKTRVPMFLMHEKGISSMARAPPC